MSDRVNMLLAKEILGGDARIFSHPACKGGTSKSYLISCFESPSKLNYAFIWDRTKQGDSYWRECYDKAIPKEKIQERLSILLPLIYDKPLTLEDLM